MEKSGFIVKFYDKAYEDKSIEELCKSPVSAISGVSESDAVVLEVAFGIRTVEDLAMNKYVRLAQGINARARHFALVILVLFTATLQQVKKCWLSG